MWSWAQEGSGVWFGAAVWRDAGSREREDAGAEVRLQARAPSWYHGVVFQRPTPTVAPQRHAALGALQTGDATR